MQHYIKEIFEGKETEHAHNKFVRYSRGIFVGPLLKIKFGKSNIKLYGSFHFIDEFLALSTELLGNRKVHLTGSLVWNKDLAEELAKHGIKYSKVKKARGIYTYLLENDVELKTFSESMSKYNILPSFKTEEVSLVTKTKFPKPNKEFTSDFCKLTIAPSMEKKIREEFAFDVEEKKVKEIVIRHEIVIENIELPKIDDFEKARKLAKREGKLTRVVTVNDKETKTEKNFKI